MRAAVFESAGSPIELLRLIDVDVPVPRGHETLVKVDASPIQPSDLMFIEGRYRIRPAFPQVAGLEGTGIVTVVGPDARIPVQTRVAFRHPGAWAEFALVPDDRLYIVPDGIPVESAAQFSHSIRSPPGPSSTSSA